MTRHVGTVAEGQDRAGLAVMGVFFVQAAAGGGIFARIPDIQERLGIGEATLGLALLGQSVGALLMFLFASALIERYGTRVLLGASIPTVAISLGLMAVAPAPVALSLAFFLFGVSFALSNVAMNVEADRVEAVHGVRIMNRCHGLWSLGFLGAALLATAARGLGVPAGTHLWALVPVVIIATLVLNRWLIGAPPRAHTGDGAPKRLSVPTIGTLLLVGFGLAGVLVEVSTRHWSVIFMRDSFDLPDWVETLTLPAFLIAMTLGRLFADGWTARFGPGRVALVLTGVALAGIVLVVFAPSLWVALAGFGLMGLGVCVSFPLMLSAAARLGDRPASANVGAVTMTITLVNLGTPALMGLVAQEFGIRMTFALIIPMAVLAMALARHLEPPAERM